jgi:glycosyltransferase 2 family protein
VVINPLSSADADSESPVASGSVSCPKKPVIKALLAILALSWLISSVGWRETLAALAQIPLASVACGLLLLLLAQCLSAWRWQCLGQQVGLNASLSVYYRWYLSGMFASLFLPSSVGGDVVKAIGVANQTGQKKRIGLLTVLADRVIGFSALVWMMGLIWFVPEAHREAIPVWIQGTYGLILLGVIGFWVLWWTVPRAWLFEKLPWVSPTLKRLDPKQDLLKAYRYGPWLWQTLATSFISHGLMLLFHVQLAEAFGLPSTLTPWYWFQVYGLTSLVSVLPFTPSGLGVREGTYLLLLKPWGVSGSVGMAYGLAFFSVVALVSLIGGLLWLLPSRGALNPQVKPQMPNQD